MTSYRFERQQLISIFILLAGLAWIWASRIPTDSGSLHSIIAPQESFLAPDFYLTTLSEFRVSPVIIKFWAICCPPCRAEMPAFQQVFAEYEDPGLIIASVYATNQDSLSESAAFGKILSKKLDGRIVNILDWRSLQPDADHLPYTICKAELAALTKSMVAALAPNTTANGIAFGAVLPPSDGSSAVNILSSVPLSRWAEIAEVEETFYYQIQNMSPAKLSTLMVADI